MVFFFFPPRTAHKGHKRAPWGLVELPKNLTKKKARAFTKLATSLGTVQSNSLQKLWRPLTWVKWKERWDLPQTVQRNAETLPQAVPRHCYGGGRREILVSAGRPCSPSATRMHLTSPQVLLQSHLEGQCDRWKCIKQISTKKVEELKKTILGGERYWNFFPFFFKNTADKFGFQRWSK